MKQDDKRRAGGDVKILGQVQKKREPVRALRNLPGHRSRKKNLISKGDDYQVLFTSNLKNRNSIKKISSTKKIKITRIGKILNGEHKSSIIDRNGHQVKINNKGYFHTFN